MVATYEIRYARSGGVNVAYCVWGEGDEVVVYTPPLVSNVELLWDLTELERIQTRAGRHVRALMIDKRGVGMSDRIDGGGGIEERIGDVLTVMDHAGVDRAHICGASEGGVVGIALAALAPERVKSLAVIDAPASGVPWDELEGLADDAAPMPDQAEWLEGFRSVVRTWGTPQSTFLEWFVPSAARSDRVRAWSTRFERLSASPGSLRDYIRKVAALDLRPFVERVATPTLVQHIRNDPVVPAANGRWLAAHLAGAQYIEYEGIDHWWPFAAAGGSSRTTASSMRCSVPSKRIAFRTASSSETWKVPKGMSAMTSGRRAPRVHGAREHEHFVHRGGDGRVVAQHGHRRGVADENEVDAPLVGKASSRSVVGGDHHDPLPAQLHLGELGDGELPRSGGRGSGFLGRMLIAAPPLRGTLSIRRVAPTRTAPARTGGSNSTSST